MISASTSQNTPAHTRTVDVSSLLSVHMSRSSLQCTHKCGTASILPNTAFTDTKYWHKHVKLYILFTGFNMLHLQVRLKCLFSTHPFRTVLCRSHLRGGGTDCSSTPATSVQHA
jgi:hypothetical protein